MIKTSIFLLLTIAVISKGQQQQKNLQRKLNELYTPNKSNKESNVQVEPQNVKEVSGDPITFPATDDDDRDFSAPPVQASTNAVPANATSVNAPSANANLANQSANSILQSIDQNLPVRGPLVELARPTRVAVAAATSATVPNRYTIDQLDYVRDFSWTMFQGSKLPSPIGNLVLSPIQPQLQLSLLRTAAADLTQEEIAHAIREVNPSVTRDLVNNLKVVNSVSTNLGVASAMFTRNNLKLNNSFIQAAHDRDVNIVPVNFDSQEEAKYTINNWVANATNNRIKDFFKPGDAISTDSQVILTNSIHFNGEWKYGFNEVKSEPFYTTDKLSKNVPMMKNLVSLRTGPINLRNGFSGRWIELPYRGDEFSMVIIVPTQRHYLDEFIRSMRANDFSNILKQLSNGYKKLVHLSMPKFTVTSSFSVVNVLLKMGVVDLFAQTSRLPYVTDNSSPLRVHDILQNGFLSVDEKGTIAAVATISHVVTLSLNSAPEEVFFNVDQPFISIIVDKRNQVPVFISKIFDP